MFCSSCGAKVSETATFCGSCGTRVSQAAPNDTRSKPGHREAPSHTRLKLLLIILLLVSGLYYLLRLNPPGSGGPSTSASQVDSSPAIEITATALVQAYQDNEVAADQRFKGTTLLVSGAVDSVGKDVWGAPYVSLRTDEEALGLRSVQAMFSRSDEWRVASLSKGQRVSIRGRCDGMLGNVLLQDSTLK
jgi:hypothetical protein